ncbi:glycosyltransferase family 4 protein [Paenibacillus pinistramenti]|uniref:glycosyltransferase family 4 protein n=1 Tax=Paenibacillus pinistramenti TaxID=1768003 RepID=UPI00110802BB|nr:glycosyltransferase family 4 protein [Paenibacillus pinistramenti]
MKITFPILTLCKGGAQRMLAELTNGLAERGHEVVILMPSSGEVEYPITAKVVRTPLFTIREQDYPESDVIISNFYTTIEAAQAASDNGKGRHIRLSLCYEPAFLPDNHITFPTYHVTDEMVVLSNWQKQLIQTLHGIEGRIVPVGISSEFRNLHLRKEQPLQISAIFRIPEGGYSWHRGQDYLAESLHKVKQAIPDVQINMISPPSEYQASLELQKLKREYQFQLFTPANDEELNVCYNEAHIFVSSSIYDTASLPGLEAMKCGAALATVYSGGNMDYCKPGQNCLLSYRYENRLSQDILQLAQDPELRRRLAAAGEEEAGKWTWDRSVDAFERMLEGI